MSSEPSGLLSSGVQAPDFALARGPNETFSSAELRERPAILAFYPADWSPVCGDQLALYQAILPEFEEYDAQLVGISVDGVWCHRAYAEARGLTFPLLSDFEPKGEVARAYGSYVEKMGFANRTLVLIDEDGTVAWTYESPNPGEFPGANVIFDALA
jgi:peroxiredoxin